MPLGCATAVCRPQDFRVGGVINVHNRDFLLYDCDAFTRQWYQVRAALVRCCASAACAGASWVGQVQRQACREGHVVGHDHDTARQGAGRSGAPSLYADVLACLLQAELGFPAEALEGLEVAEPIPPMPAAALPPYNGYGTLDDSKQNCIALVPKPPKKVSEAAAAAAMLTLHTNTLSAPHLGNHPEGSFKSPLATQQ